MYKLRISLQVNGSFDSDKIETLKKWKKLAMYHQSSIKNRVQILIDEDLEKLEAIRE